MSDDIIDNVPTLCGECALLAERYRIVRQLGQGGALVVGEDIVNEWQFEESP